MSVSKPCLAFFDICFSFIGYGVDFQITSNFYIDSTLRRIQYNSTALRRQNRHRKLFRRIRKPKTESGAESPARRNCLWLRRIWQLSIRHRGSRISSRSEQLDFPKSLLVYLNTRDFQHLQRAKFTGWFFNRRRVQWRSVLTSNHKERSLHAVTNLSYLANTRHL